MALIGPFWKIPIYHMDIALRNFQIPQITPEKKRVASIEEHVMSIDDHPLIGSSSPRRCVSFLVHPGFPSMGALTRPPFKLNFPIWQLVYSVAKVPRLSRIWELSSTGYRGNESNQATLAVVYTLQNFHIDRFFIRFSSCNNAFRVVHIVLMWW